MQTSLKESSEFFDRILQIIEYKGIKSVNIFATKVLGYDAPQKINRLKKKENSPSFEIVRDIVNKFEEIDANWLLTGRGEMLKTRVNNSRQEEIGSPNSKDYTEGYWRGRYDELLEKHKELLQEVAHIKSSSTTPSGPDASGMA